MRTMTEMPNILTLIVPRVGSIWEWEPLKSYARETLLVTDVKWNGEAAWVESEPVSGKGHRVWNELDRWVEATVLVEPAPGDA